MKRFLKSVLRRVWRATAILRRPFVIVTDKIIDRMVQRHVTGPGTALGRIEADLHALQGISDQLSNETNLLLDSILREVGRLQQQVQDLQEAVDRRDEGNPPASRPRALAG